MNNKKIKKKKIEKLSFKFEGIPNKHLNVKLVVEEYQNKINEIIDYICPKKKIKK